MTLHTAANTNFCHDKIGMNLKLGIGNTDASPEVNQKSFTSSLSL